ncbi:unnamed protein product [Peniophora sp. CBMAI 1063]|nr:unnamed protein product [Peniophora sp. CBMAI 1063]
MVTLTELSSELPHTIHMFTIHKDRLIVVQLPTSYSTPLGLTWQAVLIISIGLFENQAAIIVDVLPSLPPAQAQLCPTP